MNHAIPGAHDPRDHFEFCRSELATLPVRHQAAFSASCAERQFGTYEYVSRSEPHRRPTTLRTAINLGWSFAAAEPIRRASLAASRDAVMALIPNLDRDPSGWASLILDATASAVHLLNVCLEGRVDDAVSAATSSFNAVDEWVQNIVCAPPGELQNAVAPTSFDAVYRQVTSHPMVIRELAQQLADIAFLKVRDVIRMRGLRPASRLLAKRDQKQY